MEKRLHPDSPSLALDRGDGLGAPDRRIDPPRDANRQLRRPQGLEGIHRPGGASTTDQQAGGKRALEPAIAAKKLLRPLGL